MNFDYARLKQVLELEKSYGCQDRAVMGGLDSFLRRLSLSDPELSSLLEVNYADLDRVRRREWLANMLERLDSPASPVSRPSAPRRPTRRRLDAPAVLSLNSPITAIKGVSQSLAAKFGKLGVRIIRDLLYFFPRRHIDYSQRRSIADLEVGTEQTVVATVWEARERRLGRVRRATEAVVGDDTGNMQVIWYNQPYLARSLPPGARLVISGKVSLFRGRKVFESPAHERLETEDDDLVHTGRLVPVYPSTAGLYPRSIRRLVKQTVDLWAPRMDDFLPEEVRGRAHLLPLPEAIRQTHYPDTEQTKDKARRRLAFDELFLIQLGVMAKRRDWQEEHQGKALAADPALLEPFLASLPFSLTGAQRRCLHEILGDLAQSKPMSRLLQGEVGSGKTVVATLALLLAVASGYQAALMAPTEILAEQHFQTICRLLNPSAEPGTGDGPVRTFTGLLPRPLGVGLLVGSMREGAKQEVRESISRGEAGVVIGTHALVQEMVSFDRLALCVVDEQHRFGVMQRAALRRKGEGPHLLAMSATPIPRTLALTLYGDLDLSVIDELPPGRQEIRTRWLGPQQRERAYEFVRGEVQARRQAFIICPLIEESESLEAPAATAEYQRLSREVFPDLKIGLLHGQMPAAEKDEVMRRFRAGELDILVSTPVVEVGVDVPNATVMLIEGADRFGLAQLHQFRGRVGRGEHQSYCLLLAESPSPEARERLEALERTQDGFALAEEDLRLRGPGEFFGTRQSGLPDLKMARLSDVALLEQARGEAMRLFEADPYLKSPEHQALAAELSRLWRNDGDLS